MAFGPLTSSFSVERDFNSGTKNSSWISRFTKNIILHLHTHGPGDRSLTTIHTSYPLSFCISSKWVLNTSFFSLLGKLILEAIFFPTSVAISYLNYIVLWPSHNDGMRPLFLVIGKQGGYTFFIAEYISSWYISWKQ